MILTSIQSQQFNESQRTSNQKIKRRKDDEMTILVNKSLVLKEPPNCSHLKGKIMDPQETYFITEIVSEPEEKPILSNIHKKMGSYEHPLPTNSDGSRSGSYQRLRKNRKIMKINIDEKKKLAKLVEKEPTLWDCNNALHFHGPALSAAWKRISRASGRDISECKIIWKSLKDAVRYRKNKIAKTDGADEPIAEYEMDSNWEFNNCLSFLMDAPSPIVKRPQRSFPMEFDDSQTTTPNGSVNIPTECNDETSASESNFSYQAPRKQQDDDPLFVESMLSMANSIKELAKGVAEKQNRQVQATNLKFDYIWRNLDTFFAKLPPEDVDELNFQFIQMAYERVKKVGSS